MVRKIAFASLLLAGTASAAYAQSPANPPAEQGGTNLTEVVVTAQRVTQRLQDVPVAVTAFDARGLENRNVQTLDAVARFTPNVRFDTAAQLSGASYNATVFIRGVGQNDFAIFSDPGVGIYVDDVYYARSIGAVLDAVDLQSVQVLRGPQGTLFGKNTIGGAVIVTTKKPTDEFTGYVEATTGRYGRADGQLVLNAPIVKGVLDARLTAGTFHRDGFVKRLWDGSDQGNRNSSMVRFQLRFTPNERLTVDFSSDYTYAREHQAQNKLLAVAPAPGLTGVPFLANWNRFVAPTKGIVAPNGQPTVNQSWITNDPFTTWAGGPNKNNLDLWGVQTNIAYELTDKIQLKSITAYRNMHADFARDGDNTPFTFRETANNDKVWQFSQEFQLNGRSLNDKINWVTGLYLFKEDGSDIARADIAPGLNPGVSTPPFSPAQSIQNYITNKSWALFGQAAYAVTDQLSLTVGARYNHDDKRLRIFDVLDYQAPNPFINVNRQRSWDSFTPHVGLDFKITPDAMIYWSFSKGFKSGGFNARPTASEAEVTPYNPEQLTTYELGTKTSWLDRRLILNAAAYWSDYADIQLTVNQTPQNFVANAAQARIRGFEVETVARPLPWLDLNAALGYTDAQYIRVGTGNPLQVLPIQLGTKLVKTPKWTLSGGAQATQELNGLGTLVYRVDASYSSKYYNDVAASELIAEPGYTLVNARITWTAPNANWKVAVFGTNLTDARYFVSGNTSPSFGLAEVAYGRPREWGVTVGYSF